MISNHLNRKCMDQFLPMHDTFNFESTDNEMEEFCDFSILHI